MSRHRFFTAALVRHVGTSIAAALSAGALVLSIGCAPDGDPDGDDDTPTEWLGTDPHFRAVGTLNGEELDLNVEGDAAADASSLFCEREYIVPQNAAGEFDYANGELVEVKLHAFVTVGGEERKAEIEFKRHDMSADSAGTKLTVVPRNDASEPASGELYLEWEWKSAAGEDIYEQSAQTGSVTVGEFTGTPDETGLLIPDNEGTVGVFATGQWSETESVALSFTAPCGPNAVESVQ